MIKTKSGITDEEFLAELEAMSWEDIMALPLTERFSGLFKGFSEMSKVAEMAIGDMEMTDPKGALEWAQNEKIKELEEEVERLKEENEKLKQYRDHWLEQVDVYEKERSKYYRAFDILAAKLGLFRETDPCSPKSSFKKIYKKFRKLKKKYKSLKHNALGKETKEDDADSDEKYLERCHEAVKACHRIARKFLG